MVGNENLIILSLTTNKELFIYNYQLLQQGHITQVIRIYKDTLSNLQINKDYTK